MRKILVPLAGGAPIVLTKAVMFFGRGNECDIILTNSRKISRKHCCVAQINETYVVRDLGSMNGVRVNGQRAAPELPLEEGDELLIGDVGFRFQAGVQKTVVAPATTEKKGLIDRKMMNSDIPIPIEDEDVEFQVEATGAHPMIQSDEIHLIAEDEPANDDSNGPESDS